MRVIYKISEKIMRLIVTTNSRGCFLKPKYTTHIRIAFTCYSNTQWGIEYDRAISD